MARSKEAIKRRAEKRQRSEAEQRKIDGDGMRKQQRQQQQQPPKGQQQRQTETSTDNDDGHNRDDQNPPEMKEAGAWVCPRCNNKNFASRRWCYSHACNEPRPSRIAFERKQRQNDKPPRSSSTGLSENENSNDASCNPCLSRDCDDAKQPEMVAADTTAAGSAAEETPPPKDRQTIPNAKTAEGKVDNEDEASSHKRQHDDASASTQSQTKTAPVWSQQADHMTIRNNQELRRRYRETSGEGMSEEDRERAKLLLARDERKRRKKAEAVKVRKTPIKPARKGKDAAARTKAARDRNAALRKRYKETGGEGMSRDDAARARVLIERDERRAKARIEAEKSKEESIDKIASDSMMTVAQ